MSQKSSIVCDAAGCTAVKQASNHWFAAQIFRAVGHAACDGPASENGVIEIRSFEWWEKNVYRTGGITSTWKHFCGKECLFKTISIVLP